jgi:hypothetical protein
MALTVKHKQIEAAVRKLARLRGISMARAIEIAVTKELAREKAERQADMEDAQSSKTPCEYGE